MRIIVLCDNYSDNTGCFLKSPRTFKLEYYRFLNYFLTDFHSKKCLSVINIKIASLRIRINPIPSILNNFFTSKKRFEKHFDCYVMPFH